MRRRDFIGGLLAMTLGRSVDLGACGDKFLRVGRSARFRRYAAVHRVRILIYRPVQSTPAGINELTGFLKRAGHKPVVLDRPASVSAALPRPLRHRHRGLSGRGSGERRVAVRGIDGSAAADTESIGQGHRKCGNTAVFVSYQASCDDHSTTRLPKSTA